MSWYQLRCNLSDNTSDALEQINSWWQRTPWVPYYLHWDDQQHWPDPWQLLADNIYCDVARALGIMYTLAIISRRDFQNAQMIECALGNLVLVESEKYILNYHDRLIVNTPLQYGTIKNRLVQQQIYKKIK